MMAVVGGSEMVPREHKSGASYKIQYAVESVRGIIWKVRSGHPDQLDCHPSGG